MDQPRAMLICSITQSTREVLVTAMLGLVALANDEQLHCIRSFFNDCASIPGPRSTTHGHKRPRGSSSHVTQSCTILRLDHDLISVALFPFVSLPDHCRLARTCHRFFTLSGCSPPRLFYSRLSVWDKQVRVPVDISDCNLAKLCTFVCSPSVSMVSCREVTDGGLVHLQQLPLRKLDLAACTGITDTGLTHINRLPLLHALNLAFCNNITNAGLAHLQLMCLRTLSIYFCQQITDGGLVHLKTMPLRSLSLGSTRITDAGLVHLTSCVYLETLHLDGCRITDAGLVHLKQLPIHELFLGYCKNFTDDGLVHLTTLQLHTLNLRDTQITDAGLLLLKSQLNLGMLDLTCCGNITDAGLVHLQRLPLHTLVLNHCKNITSVGLAKLNIINLIHNIHIWL